MRTAADTGHADACMQLASAAYRDLPYAREIGNVMEAAGVAKLAGVMEGHDIPLDVMNGVLHWLRKGGHNTLVAILSTSYGAWRWRGLTLPQRGVRGGGPSEGLQSLPAVQDRPILRRRMSETRLDHGWAQGKVWHMCVLRTVKRILRSRSVGRWTCYIASTCIKVETQLLVSTAR